MNTSGRTWPENGLFRLSYHWFQGAKTVVFDGHRTMLPSTVQSEGAIPLNAKVTAPSTPGSYTLKWDMVEENVAWFSWRAVPTKDVNVNVVP